MSACFPHRVQPVVGAERPVFFREQAAGMYSVLPFNLAQVPIRCSLS